VAASDQGVATGLFWFDARRRTPESREDIMTAVRIVVEDVDATVAAMAAAGYSVAQRWGPPFAILTGAGPDLWVSGPGTSAARSHATLSAAEAGQAAVRLVVEVDDPVAAVAQMVAAGWEVATEALSGPGGTQQLMRRGPVFVEVFASR
jgi:hypothetical protein